MFYSEKNVQSHNTKVIKRNYKSYTERICGILL